MFGEAMFRRVFASTLVGFPRIRAKNPGLVRLMSVWMLPKVPATSRLGRDLYGFQFRRARLQLGAQPSGITLLSIAMVLLPLTCGAQTPVSASPPPPRTEVSGFGGRFFGGTLARGTNALFDVPVDIADGANYGLRFGYKASRQLELGFHMSRAPASFVAGNTGLLFGGAGQDLGEFTVTYLLGYGSVRLGERRSVPYMTFGAGSAVLDPAACRGSEAACRRETRFTGTLGTGFKVFFRRRVGVRFDGHYYATWLPISECPAVYRCDKNRWLSNGDANVGFVFAF